jgi:hypothetical protein
LLVVGRAADAELAASVRGAAAHDARIRPYLEHCPAEDVQKYFLAADAVVLPYRDVLTSGVAVLAARFGRPCIAPRSAALSAVLPSGAVLSYDDAQRSTLHDALVHATTADLSPMGRCLHEGVFPDWSDVAEQTAQAYGIATSVALGPALPETSWSQRLLLARRDVESVVPAAVRLTLVDDGSLIGGLALGQDSDVFPTREGVPWGPPANDEEAVQALDRLVHDGSCWLVVPWPSFWWFDVYPRFTRRLNSVGTCVRRTDRVAIYELRGDRRAA